MLLSDKIIFVTGGNGLLGKSIVHQLTSDGAKVISGDLNIENELTKGLIQCDVTNADSVRLAVSAIYEHFGRIDGFVNAAYPRTKDWGNKFEDIQIDSWRANVDMQLNSVFHLCQEVLEKMKLQGFGSLVNMASIYGVVGPDFGVYEGTPITMPAAYAAIKGGVINFTRYLASYYGAYNIRVNVVSPGGIFDNQHLQFVKNYEAKVPMKRMGTPEDISGAVSFLLSDRASYITGHNLIVDGGWTTI